MWVPATSKGFYLDPTKAQSHNWFYTDPYGRVHDTYPYEPNSVRQFIKRGTWKADEFGTQGSCVTETNRFGNRVPREPVRSFFKCGSSSQNMNIDGALALPN
jgi:hypothetical protein